MKYVISVILSVLLFFNSSLYIIIYYINIYQLSYFTSRQIMIQGSNSENMILQDSFPGNSPEIHLIKMHVNNPNNSGKFERINESEFLLNGNYCDIIYEKQIGDTLYLYYFNDYKEDELQRDLIAHFKNESGSSPEMKYFNILFSFLSNAVCPFKDDSKPPENKKDFSVNCSPGILCLYNDIIPPPPKT